jgi:hypothetical protein
VFAWTIPRFRAIARPDDPKNSFLTMLLLIELINLIEHSLQAKTGIFSFVQVIYEQKLYENQLKC